MIPLCFNNAQTNGLLDTGADISAVSQSFFNKLKVNTRDLKPPSISFIKGAGGAVHKITAEAVLDMQIDNLKIKHRFFIVPDLHQTCILGHDFLTEYKVQISYENNTVKINDRQTQAEINLITTNSKARLTRATYIPPGTIRTVQIHMPEKGLTSDKAIMLSPSTKLTELQIALIECLVPSHKQTAWVQIANLTQNAVKLSRKTPIADIHVIDTRDVQMLSNQNLSNVNSLRHETHKQETINAQTHPTETKTSDIKFDLSNSDLNDQQKQDLLCLLREYRDCFATSMDEIGCTPLITHSIDTTDEIPVKARAYKTSPEMKRVLEDEVQTLLDNDIIEHSSSDYASPVILVRKPNNTYRLVVDFRKLNQKIKDVVFPLPLLSDVIDQIGTSKSEYFSSLDLKSGYFQVPLGERYRHKTAFICHHGLFQFKRMVMGLSTSSATFQKLMNNVFKGLSWHILLCYLDDVLVHSKTFEDHLQHLRLVFDRLRLANLTLTPSKCFFATKSVKFLGHRLSKHGSSPEKSNTHAIDTFPTPRTQKQVRQFLGMAGYFRKFVKDYSRIAYPLFKLLTKETTNSKGHIVWTEDCDRAFKDLKRALTTEPVVLKYPTPDGQMYLTTDGSKKGVSYILSQEDDKGVIRPVCYGGKSLRPEQANWPVSHIELYAIILGIREYRPYLASRKFKILTDCKSLTWLKTTKHTNGRLIRWNLELMQYNFEISHLSGRQNVVADTLSRRRYNDETERHTQTSDDETDMHASDMQHMTALHSNTTNNADYVQNIANGDQTQLKHVQMQNQSKMSANANELPSLLEQEKQAFVRALQTGTDTTQTKVNVGKLQEECDELKPLYMYMKYDTLPNNTQQAKQIVIESQQYAILNNRLYHLYQPRTKNRDPKSKLEHQLVIPKCLRPDVLHAYHDSATGACHPGFKRTFESIRMKYYWKHMYQEVSDYTSTCTVCQEMKRDPSKRVAPLKPYQIDPIFSRWHIDFLSGLPTTRNGNKNILLAIDSFSHITEAFALKTQSADEVAKILYENIICRYGCPTTLVADNAANFKSKIVNALCDTFHIKNQSISSYNPHSNGIIEKQVGILTQCLRTLCSETPNKWDEHLQSAMMAFRLSPSLNSTGYSPFYLMTGRHMHLPIDNILDNRPSVTGCLHQYIEDMTKNLHIIRDTAKRNILKHKEIFKERYDRKSKIPNFRVGQHVYVTVEHIPVGVSRKLYPRYSGPFYITQKGKNHSYKLRHCTTNKALKYTVHANRLKLYKDPRDVRRERYLPRLQNHNHDPAPPARLVPTQRDTAQDAKDTEAIHEGQDTHEAMQRNPPPDIHDEPLGPENAQGPPPQGEITPQEPRRQQNTIPGEDGAKQSQSKNTKRRTEIEPRSEGVISGDTSPTDERADSQENDDIWYEAEKLLKSKRVNGQKHYLVQWSDKNAKPSWEPECNITPLLIEQFHIKKTSKQNRKRKKTRK